jgi:hypothetical protein
MAWDGITQMFGWRESTWELRLITGTLFGLGTTWFVLPLIQRTLDEDALSSIQRPIPAGGMYQQPLHLNAAAYPHPTINPMHSTTNTLAPVEQE